MPSDEEISKQVPRASGFFLTECLPEDYNDMYHRVNDDGHNELWKWVENHLTVDYEHFSQAGKDLFKDEIWMMAWELAIAVEKGISMGEHLNSLDEEESE